MEPIDHLEFRVARLERRIAVLIDSDSDSGASDALRSQSPREF